MMDMPIVSHANGEYTRIVRVKSPINMVSTVIPTDERGSKSEFITSSAEVGVTARIPTKPAKVHTPPRMRVRIPDISNVRSFDGHRSTSSEDDQ